MEIEGVVTDFDEVRGDGTLTTHDGEHFYFHCVCIADGSRSISVGTSARGRRAPGRLGHDEVVDVRAVL